MKTLNTRIQKLFAASLGLCAIMLPAVVDSAPGTLATQPLFTGNAIKPNIMLSLDDSGSMDWETLFNTNSGLLYWDDDNDNFADDGVINTSGESFAFGYLFPNGLGFSDGRRLDETYHPVPPLPQYGYARSATYNKAYYDPNVTYQPWVDYSGQTFGNIDPTDAPADPYSGRNTDRLDLTQRVRDTGTYESFVVLDNMIFTKGEVYYNGSSWVTAGTDLLVVGNFYLPIEYYPATYYKVTSSGTYQVKDGATTINGDCSTPNDEHYDDFHDQPQDLKALGSSDVDALGPDGRCLKKVEIEPGTAEMQNFANWFSYYRKRHLALRAGLSIAFDDITGVRTGGFTINDPADVTMRDIDTEKDTIYGNFYSFDIEGGTPNRGALDFAGNQYKRDDSDAPVTAECQKNFTLMFTDGYANDTVSVGNQDGGKGAPYEDDFSDTLADVAMKYYTENIRSDLAPTGQVPLAPGCDSASPDPSLDCNADLHMVTFTVGLGVSGSIFGQTHFNVADAYASPPAWPNAAASSIEQIDDLYHAAVNGRGELLNAQTPADLADMVGEALKTITAQVGSSASVAFNTSVLSTGSVVYQARFNTSKWKGELLSFDLNPISGDVATTPSWDAGDNLPAPASRVIYTYNPDITVGTDKSKGVLFEAATSSDLSDTQLPTIAISDLSKDLPTVSGLSPELTPRDRLNYLRGVRTYEGPEPSSGKSRFRERHEDSVLGDIIHSAPLFVGDAVLNWPTGDGSVGSFPAGTASYETWQDSVSRTPVVYVGANDGMLHGFNAKTGEELMAYIPGSLYSTATGEGLHYLSEPTYQHRYYVDNTPSRTDAYIKGRTSSGTVTSRAWRSVIVGTLRGGGKGVFALDVTDPSSFGADTGSAAKTALWEFTNNDDADLGYTFSRPTIVPTNATSGGDIRWAAIFGNGYNNGGDCHAKLFVLFLDGGLDGTWTAGSDYLELDTNMGTTGDCNGLSTPAVVDLNADGKADAAYAGDLHGNMWHFDLCNKIQSGSDAGLCQGTGWDVAYSAPLFTATDAGGTRQPITAAPIVISHPTVLSGGLDPNVLVLFGTGQYLVDGDKTNPAPPSHTYYGIWDRGDDSLDRSSLMQQVFETGFGVGADFRITGLEVPDYTGTPSTRQYGWYLDLPDTSEADNSASGAPERVVTRSVVIGDIVFFNTLVPTANGCDIGGYGYLMSVETKNGGRPDTSIIDVNGDGKIDSSDFQSVGGENAAVTGKKVNEGILSEPAFLGDNRYESTSKGKIIKDDVDPSGLTSIGRYSWQEIRAK